MRFLIVGLGSMGKRRARLAAGLGHEICGVDSAEARRAEAEALGIAAYPTLDAALAARRFNAAFVCTAPLSHAALAGQLLDAGLPVFTELNLVDTGYAELIEKAKQRGLPLFLSSTMLYRAEIAFIRNTLAAFAKPVSYIYHIGQYLPDWHPWETYKDFFVGDARTGGVREIFGIELPWLVTAFGAAAPVCVQQSRLSKLDIAYPDSVFTTLQHQGGTKGFLAVDVVSPKPVRNLEIFGEGLHLFWEGSPQSLYVWDAAAGQKRQIQPYQSFEQDNRYSDNIVENAYLDEILDFIALLKGEAQPRWSFAQDWDVVRLMDAIEQFAPDGQGGTP